MSMEFWLGTFLSIPIGLGTSLATPWLQRRIEERGKQKALNQWKNIQSDLERMSFYRNNPDAFTQYLLRVVVMTTFIGAALAIISGLLFTFGSYLDSVVFAGEIRTACYVVGQLVSLIGSIMIVNTCRPALSAWTKVRNFDEYESRAKAAILKTNIKGEVV